MKDLRVLSEIALNLINQQQNFNIRIDSVLDTIGRHLNVSRVYIFVDDDEGLTTSNAFEWCNNGIPPQKEELQGIPYELIPSWKSLLEQDGRVFSEDITLLPPDLRAILEPQGIKSLLVYPLKMERVIKGFIGFDENCMIRHWREKDLELLKTISGIIANAYSAELKDRQLKDYSRLLERRVAERTKELEESLTKLEQAQNQMIHQVKMASIGRLAAGVAHEINNPTGFLLSNTQTLSEYVTAFTRILDLYAQWENSSEEKTRETIRREIIRLKSDEEFEFIKEDIRSLLRDSETGVRRISKIVKGLQTFAREENEGFVSVSLTDVAEDSLQVVWNKLKYHCTVEKIFSETPPILGNPGQLEQVVINLLLNAADAVADRGRIVIRTGLRQNPPAVILEVEDDGAGIPQDVRERIFEPFFTTKEGDKGTGLGLAISHGIVERHHGKIELESTLGKGSLFRVVLPLGA